MDRAIGRTLVVGAGVSGIRSALDLAQIGYQVLLIDRSDHVGGLLCQLDSQFPTNACGYCRMLPMNNRDKSSQHCLRRGLFHENIQILLSTQLMSIQGQPGDFNVTLKQGPSLIDPSLCTGCGECERVCPVIISDGFNENLTQKKAVYLPSSHSFSNAYTIDPIACNRCGECMDACPTGAIRLQARDREKFKIMVVDDEKIIRSSMSEWLTGEGFYVATADSGQKALDLIKNESFNLLLTDIKMPGMDGVDLLTQAKERAPDLCVIMMTAYAAVDSAVEAMKQGALDYLIKPFDPQVLIAMVLKVFQAFELSDARVENVDAVILSGGAQFFEPDQGKNQYGYGVLPGVVTNIEFERLISFTGSYPDKNILIHPKTGQAVKKIAWLQCVGSRDVQTDAPFCSSVCCMISIKQAILVKNRFGPDVETTIFHMDLRTCGKSFDEYRMTAQNENQVRLIQARIHSLFKNIDSSDTSLLARYADIKGKIQVEKFDMVVLATGQRPAKEMTLFARENDIEINDWGFIDTQAFSQVNTLRPGIFSGGSISGLKDIGDSVICASAAALESCRVMQDADRLTRETASTEMDSKRTKKEENLLQQSRQPPKILTAICCCSDRLNTNIKWDTLVRDLEQTPENDAVEVMDQLCTPDGWEALVEKVKAGSSNRLILAACQPFIHKKNIIRLESDTGFNADLVETCDIASALNRYPDNDLSGNAIKWIQRELKLQVSKARFKNPLPVERTPSIQNALVIGGGIAGVTAALAIADCGYHVDLVEKSDALGGNLLWMDKTIDGSDIREYAAAKINRVESHDNVTVHKKAMTVEARPRLGGMDTILEKICPKAESEPVKEMVSHGVTVLATGGTEAPVDRFENNSLPNVFTQKMFDQAILNQEVDPEKIDTVVMIQCAGTRNEKRNYCSRVCCIHALKTAFFLKDVNPNVEVFILYRDMMSYGFFEQFYMKAKNIGVRFFQYEPPEYPVIEQRDKKLFIKTKDRLLDLPVEIEADYAIMAAGIASSLPKSLAGQYNAMIDKHHFFKEADTKFRPVESMDYRVFSCGLTLKPCTIEEAITSAKAASARALELLCRNVLISGKIVSCTHTALCSLCEMCVDTCPYGARAVDIVEEKIRIDPAACQGCGVCAMVCPSNAAFLEGFETAQMLDMIDMAMS